MATPSEALYGAALAAGVTLMIVANFLLLLWVLRRGYVANPDQEHAAAAKDGRGKGLSADERKTLPWHDFFSSDDTAGDCAVCLEAFEAGDRCRQLPRCEHSFHTRCVDPWLEKSRCCPVCRADVVPKGEGDELVIIKVAMVETTVAERS